MRFSLLIVSFICLSLPGFSQSILSGRVVEKQTGNPVPYANIVIIDTRAGTATDENGNFSIRILDENRNRSIRVSSIGFLNRTHKVDSMLSLKEKIVVELASDAKELNEISIDSKRITPQEIVTHAVKSISKNYNQQPFNAEYYSKIETKNPTNDALYTLESILFGYYEGYGRAQKRKFKIMQKRETGTNPLADGQYWPSHELFQADLLSHPEENGIFALKHINKFDLAIEDVAIYDEDTVQVINYVLPRPRKETTGYGIVPKQYNGKLYITMAGAIVRHVIHAPPFHFDIIYRRIGEHYYPYLVKGNRVYKNIVRITNVISLRQIELNNVQQVSPGADDWDVSKIVFNPEYWRDNYPNGR